jgi:RNA polymerase sigma factor (sigma-70 family)
VASPSTDADLLAGCRAGDPGAWDALVERFSRYVHAIAVKAYGLPSQEAEDVFQEVFTRVYEHLDRLRSDDALRPWIAQITRRLCIDRLRVLRREQPEAEGEGESAAAEETLLVLDEAMSVRAALDAIGDPCRDILDRFFCREESYRTIGDALQLPPGTIASRISRCLAKLRSQLEEENASPACLESKARTRA